MMNIADVKFKAEKECKMIFPWDDHIYICSCYEDTVQVRLINDPKAIVLWKGQVTIDNGNGCSIKLNLSDHHLVYRLLYSRTDGEAKC